MQKGSSDCRKSIYERRNRHQWKRTTMNHRQAEDLLREFLLSHRPKPFEEYIAVGIDPSNTKWIVLREPGTLHDLVISIKFLEPQTHNHPCGSRVRIRSNQRSVTRHHWEHAMYSGMSWRRRLNKGKPFYRSPENGLTRSDTPYQEAQSRRSLIIAATFTNEFGLELVGHVDDSPMEDVQFRIRRDWRSFSTSTFLEETLQYSKIFGNVQVYRWRNLHDMYAPKSNIIGFLSSEKNRTVARTPSTSERLSLKSLSIILQRNSSYQKPIGEWPAHQKVPKELISILWKAQPRPPTQSCMRFHSNITTMPTPLGSFGPPNRSLKTNGRQSSGEPESRDDKSTTRTEQKNIGDIAKNDGDIAINLLCPYPYPRGIPFVILNETWYQRAMRHKIKYSPWCRYLKGRFVMEILPQQGTVRQMQAGFRKVKR